MDGNNQHQCLPLWTARHDAAELLARCRRNPPVHNRFSQHYGGKQPDRWGGFTGPRVARLEQIREQHLCELTGADWSAADPDINALHAYSALSKAQPTVEEAILTAIEGLQYVTRDVAVPLGAAA